MRLIEQSLVRRRSGRSTNLGLDRAGFFERLVSPVFVDRFQAARGHANADELFQLRNPDPVFVQIGNEQARHILGHVPAAEKEQRVEAGAPPADESPETTAEVGAIDPIARSEETQIGGS